MAALIFAAAKKRYSAAVKSVSPGISSTWGGGRNIPAPVAVIYQPLLIMEKLAGGGERELAESGLRR